LGIEKKSSKCEQQTNLEDDEEEEEEDNNNNNNNESVWKNLLASSLLSLLSLFGVCSNRHRKMAGNRGDEKETRGRLAK